ncbi:Glycosyltransferase, GT2 family [Lachnospiraceae bacterium A10]|nr:Glycosyltransferase, GT2 family [Lachnospiraceae bacterium A10]
MSKKIHIICVLYNDVISNIKSLENFYKMQDKYGVRNIKIHIYDNSKDVFVLKNQSLMKSEQEMQDRIHYMENGGNIGLTKTYNKALKEVQNADEWLMFADDDTFFSEEYLDHAIGYINSNDCKEQIVTGLIHAADRILGPTRTDTWKLNNHPLESVGVYDNIYCINSGLFINRAIYDMIGLYDEEMFLDMVDFYLMENLRQHGLNHIRVVDGLIEQTFSGDQNVYNEGVAVRFQIFQKDFKLYCKFAKKSWMYQQIILKRRALRIWLMKHMGKAK